MHLDKSEKGKKPCGSVFVDQMHISAMLMAKFLTRRFFSMAIFTCNFVLKLSSYFLYDKVWCKQTHYRYKQNKIMRPKFDHEVHACIKRNLRVKIVWSTLKVHTQCDHCWAKIRQTRVAFTPIYLKWLVTGNNLIITFTSRSLLWKFLRYYTPFIFCFRNSNGNGLRVAPTQRVAFS